jgi:hypothetical protein
MTRSSGTNEVSTAITLQIALDMAARILDKLRPSPFSVEELAVDLKRKPFEIRRPAESGRCTRHFSERLNSLPFCSWPATHLAVFVCRASFVETHRPSCGALTNPSGGQVL